MGKRKVFVKTDLKAQKIGCRFETKGKTIVDPNTTPPEITKIVFGRNATSLRSFDFAHWYGIGIDLITHACQLQIERFLSGQDGEIQASTLTNYCRGGLSTFLDYLTLCAAALRHELTLKDINRELIDGYLNYIALQGVSVTSQKSRYSSTKSVLQALGRQGLITLVASGDTATFPRNPFPNINRQETGETPLPKKQRQEFAAAVKQAVMPIWRDDVPLTSELLAFALMIVALHTGRNTTPLLEMRRDCLRTHPKDNSTFLILWKRRGHNTSKIVLRTDSMHDRLVEFAPTIRTNVECLIRKVIDRTAHLCAEAPVELQAYVWLYRSRAIKGKGKVLNLSLKRLEDATKKLVADYGLKDSDGNPMRLNISRLRKTFANRIYEILDGDLASTAIALGNTPQVAARNYLVPSEEAKRDWRFMGEVLVNELLSNTIGTTFHITPLGRCSDPLNGEFAPKGEGATCINFINCMRCRHYAVTGDDLYKLFSFYFRIFTERSHMDKRRWARVYAHIPRLIDEYIIAEGLRRGVFKEEAVNAARERARAEPHPFWSFDVVSDLEVFS